MPSFVILEKCDGCKGQDKTACMYICPNDLMVLDKEKMKAWNRAPEMCWECYNCVKICPQQAIDVRGYADFVPMGASCVPLRGSEDIMWTVKFRSGMVKRFKFPIRTTPEGQAAPDGGYGEVTTDLASQCLINEPAALKLSALPTVSKQRSPRRQKDMANFETVEVTTDILLCGGGMAACGAAVEASYWAQKNGLKVTLVDKAAMDRSGAVAMGLSAINQYVDINSGNNTCEDYVRYVRTDLMGIARDDLVYDIARHVDSSVHLFEKWGLPIWLDAEGKYVHEGRWQLMINGESYKVIVAEAAKNALTQRGHEYFERVFITTPIMDGDRIAGAVGFSTREEKFYVFKAKAVLAAMGGAVHVFKPRSSGEGLGRAWYPPWNSGSSLYFTLAAGAEQTCQEVRFIPVRFKDAYGPVGAWFLLFKSRATNAFGGEYMVERRDELNNWAPYGLAKPIPANLRNYLGMLDEFEGKGPIYMRTEEAIQKIADAYKDDPKEFKKKMKELEAEAWEDFLDMTISQAILWAGTNVQPEEKSSEIAAAEPYFIGSHSGASGAWVSGPKDLAPKEYFWGYEYMSTVKGLFCAGDASGASSHKFSSGSHAEGRAAGKSMVRFVLDNNTLPNMDMAKVEEIKKEVLKPLDMFAEFGAKSSDPDINPEFMKPKMFMFRLQKIMDEYAAGVTAGFKTNKAKLERALELLGWLKEDSAKLAAQDLHELMRCHENIQRMYQAEIHVRAILFREETRWPGYYFRNDFPKLDDANWKCFVNGSYKNGQWEFKKVPVVTIVD